MEWFNNGVFHDRLVRCAGGMRFTAILMEILDNSVEYSISKEDSKYTGNVYEGVRVRLNESQYKEMLKNLPQYWFNNIEPLLREYPINEGENNNDR